MPAFEFATAGQVVFGAGKVNELPRLIKTEVKRLLLVRGRSTDSSARIRQMLSAFDVRELEVHGEPTTESIRAGVEAARGCEMVIGVGGGSVLDTGKAVAALVANPGDLMEYLEVVGNGQPLVNPPLPYIAIPTTAGTGSEVTRNAVMEVPGQDVKVSLRSPMMLPRVALVDPELTYSLPPEITASTGLDALTQLIEPFVSIKANPLTDGLCREGMQYAARSLKRAYQNGTDREAREGMSLASLFGGMALANAGLGAVHGFAGPLGGMLHAPHGALCARLLPLVMEANVRALETRQPEHPARKRFVEVARMLTEDQTATVHQGIRWTSQLVEELNIPKLSSYGMTEAQIPEAVNKTQQASSFKGNPIPLHENELREILEKAL